MIISPMGYLHHYLRQEVTELYWSASIRRLATALLAIFSIIYFYELGFSIQQILWWFFIIYLVYPVFIFLAAKVINYTGYELSMAIAVPFGVTIYLFYLLLGIYPGLFYITAILWGIYKSFYWIAYHSDFARFGSRTNIGKEIGLLKVIFGFIEMIAPLIAGFFIAWYGIHLLFVVSAIILAFSTVPILITREKLLLAPFEFKKFWHKATTKWRKDFWPNFGFGEELVAQAIWPIFIFVTIGSYQVVGLVTTLVILISFVTLLWVGKLTDEEYKSRLIKRGSWTVFAAWLGRILAINWYTVFFFDSIFNISRKSLGVPITGLFYSRPKNKDEIVYYVVFREFVLSLGKAFTALLLIILFCFTDKLYLAFVIAGLFTLLYLLWHEKLED